MKLQEAPSRLQRQLAISRTPSICERLFRVDITASVYLTFQQAPNRLDGQLAVSSLQKQLAAENQHTVNARQEASRLKVQYDSLWACQAAQLRVAESELQQQLANATQAAAEAQRAADSLQKQLNAERQQLQKRTQQPAACSSSWRPRSKRSQGRSRRRAACRSS